MIFDIIGEYRPYAIRAHCGNIKSTGFNRVRNMLSLGYIVKSITIIQKSRFLLIHKELEVSLELYNTVYIYTGCF